MGSLQTSRLVDFDVRDALEVFPIVGQHSKMVMQGGSAKEHIKIGNHLPPSAKVGAHFRKFFHNRLIQIQQGEGCEKLSKRGQMCVGIGIVSRWREMRV